MESSSETGKNLKELRSSILQLAHQRADKLMQEASATISNIEKDLEQKRSYLQDKRLTEINFKHDMEIVDVKTALSRDFAGTTLQFKQDSLNDVIKEIKRKFCQKMLDDQNYYYEKYLAKIIEDTLTTVSFKEYYITLNQNDAEYVQKTGFLKRFPKTILLKDDHFSNDDIGCIIEDKSGTIKVDQRLSKKLEANEQYLKTKLSPILFSE